MSVLSETYAADNNAADSNTVTGNTRAQGCVIDGEPYRAVNEFGQTAEIVFGGDIHVLTVIGEVEGHLLLPEQSKTTKYEHIIPQLAAVEQCDDIRALLVILNTMGGDVEAGLALAEMIASLSKPTASLVLGGGHSIGVPIAAAADRSFIVPTATMTVHPIRISGMVIGVQQSFDYLEKMQERIIRFVSTHADINTAQLRRLMMATGELAHDVGTVLIGREAVELGLIDEVGGLCDALSYLRRRVDGNEPAPQRRRPTVGDRPNEKPPLIIERLRGSIRRRSAHSAAAQKTSADRCGDHSLQSGSLRDGSGEESAVGVPGYLLSQPVEAGYRPHHVTQV